MNDFDSWLLQHLAETVEAAAYLEDNEQSSRDLMSAAYVIRQVLREKAA